MRPLARNIKRYFSFKEIVIVLMAIAFSVSAGIGFFFFTKRDVVIDDNGRQTMVRTMKTTVREALDQCGISVSEFDYISVPIDARLQRIKKNYVHIKRAVPVNILVDGQVTRLMTYRDTVKEALADGRVVLSESDRLDGISLDDRIVSDMNIKIIRVKEEIISEKTPVEFNVIKKQNDHMDAGTEKVLVEGKEGMREKQFKVVLEDGVEISRELVKDEVIQNPVDRIVEFGTVLSYNTARGGTIRYRTVLEMRATAYTSSFADTGKNPDHPLFGVTATGIRATHGVIAVDPKVIPLGTKVYVEVAGNTPDYGYAIAADTGGAIKGDLIDLYFEDSQTAKSWGCKRVKVYILAD